MPRSRRRLDRAPARRVHSLTDSASRALIDAVRHGEADGDGRVVILDIGCNRGGWSWMMLDELARIDAARRRRVDLVLVEPQQHLRGQLERLVDTWRNTSREWSAQLVSAAAWIEEGNMTIHVPGNSEATSLVALKAGRPVRHQDVPTIDLARRLRSWLDGASLSLLKMDIESAEYALLPHLVRRGAICRVNFFLVEWHMDAVRPQPNGTYAYAAADALLLRLTLGPLMRKRCERDTHAAARERPL
eukprot:6517493-Prymnesium_polylepis.1